MVTFYCKRKNFSFSVRLIQVSSVIALAMLPLARGKCTYQVDIINGLSRLRIEMPSESDKALEMANCVRPVVMLLNSFERFLDRIQIGYQWISVIHWISPIEYHLLFGLHHVNPEKFEIPLESFHFPNEHPCKLVSCTSSLKSLLSELAILLHLAMRWLRTG